MKKVNTQKLLIYGIIIMLIISLGPIITSGVSYNKKDKQIEKISNHFDIKIFKIFEEHHYRNDFSYEKNKNMIYNSPENAFVCGFVTDNETELPIEGVDVFLWGEDDEGNSWFNLTLTNSSGYYGMHTAAGYIDLYVYKLGYFSENLHYTIAPYETLWVNVSLIPYPPITVTVCGFIRNKDTDDPIPHADVDLSWEDDYGHWWDNYTYSNGSGFYQMGAPAGQIRIRAEADGFFYDYSDWYYAGENETIWINLSLEPIPPQTAVVCGYITDKMTGKPIEDADADLYWQDEEGNSDWNYTETDEFGFYKFYTQPGRIRVYAYKSNYDSESSEYYWIGDYQTFWINLSLTFEPDETLVACGYITDKVTLAPVKYAYVRYDWKDDDGHIYSKYTYADRAGLFSISIPPGSAQFYVACFGYLDFNTSWYDFNESEPVKWINVSISPEITVQIERPLPGIYINDILKTPFLSKFLSIFMPNFKPIVIGPITIEVNITQNTSGVSRVDFYIDKNFHKTDSNEPYNYTWNQTAFLTHKITVIAYDNAGPLNIATVSIRKFS